MSIKEVCDLAALVVPLSGVVDEMFGFLGEVLTDLGDREYDLLHGSVMSHNLEQDLRYHRESLTHLPLGKMAVI